VAVILGGSGLVAVFLGDDCPRWKLF